jgi:pyruvate,water dikinase
VELAMAVVVQEMVDSRCAGVMFTRSPVTGDRSVVAIEASWGVGSALVGGEVTPDRLVVSKVTGEVASRAVAEKPIQHRPDAGGGVRAGEVPAELRRVCCLAEPEIAGLVALGKRIEEHYRAPQDIEWAIADQVYVLQSRPETVWARRDAAAPIAQPRERALDHVLDVLGGRAAWR